MKISTPYSTLVPPLPDESRRALAVDLAENGQRDDIVVDECGNVLDGHHRYSFLGDKVRFRVMHGLTEAEKKAFVVRAANVQRVMTPAQRREFLASVKPLAFELRQEDPRKNTQQRIADKFGVAQQTVSDWFRSVASTITGSGNGVRPDARAKHPPEVRGEVTRRVDDGESLGAVAKDLRIPKSTVAKIAQSSKHVTMGQEGEFLDGQHRLQSQGGSEPPKRRGRKFRVDHEARKMAVLELHNQGLGTCEIAERMHIASTSVSKIKADLGVALNSESMKLWSDVDHVAAGLEGMAMKVEELTGKIESTDLSCDEKDLKRCIKSLSETTRTVSRLRSALKQKLQ